MGVNKIQNYSRAKSQNVPFGTKNSINKKSMWVWMILFLEAPISERPFRFIQQHTCSVLILLFISLHPVKLKQNLCVVE